MRVKLKVSEPAMTLSQVQEQLVTIEREKKTRLEARDKARAEAADKVSLSFTSIMHLVIVQFSINGY
jgi:hypothetical protein